MSYRKAGLFFSIILLFLITMSGFVRGGGDGVELLFFHSQGCAHCANWERYLVNNFAGRSGLEIRKYEIRKSDNAVLLQKLSRKYGVDPLVPTIFVGNIAIQEDDVSGVSGLKEAIEKGLDGPKSPLSTIQSDGSDDGKVGREVTLPAVLGAAAVDAVNPCAFAVLSLLLGTILLGSKSRGKVIGAGLAFTCSTFISYMLIGIGLLTAIKASGVQHYLYLAIGLFAIGAGLWNVKDFLWYGKWFTVEVPSSWQPKLKAITKSVSSVPGAFGVGFLTSLLLLPCTSGPYVVVLGMISSSSARLQGLFLLLIYNAIFVTPFVLITLLVGYGLTTTARVEHWRQNKLNKLHLFTGLVMLGLGVTMLVFVLTGRI